MEGTGIEDVDPRVESSTPRIQHSKFSNSLWLLTQPLGPVERHRHLPSVRDAVHDVARTVHHRAGTNLGRLAGADDLACARRNDHEFLFWMHMRWMRCGSGLEDTHAGHHAAEFVGRP